MNVYVRQDDYILPEDIVSYSNIELTHVNDNKLPRKKMMAKIVAWTIIIVLSLSLFFI